MLIHDQRQHVPHIICCHVSPRHVDACTYSHFKITSDFSSNSASAHKSAHVGGIKYIGERGRNAEPELGLERVQQQSVKGGDGRLRQAQ